MVQVLIRATWAVLKCAPWSAIPYKDHSAIHLSLKIMLQNVLGSLWLEIQSPWDIVSPMRT